jgi:hypothetical protein
MKYGQSRESSPARDQTPVDGNDLNRPYPTTLAYLHKHGRLGPAFFENLKVSKKQMGCTHKNGQHIKF